MKISTNFGKTRYCQLSACRHVECFLHSNTYVAKSPSDMTSVHAMCQWPTSCISVSYSHKKPLISFFSSQIFFEENPHSKHESADPTPLTLIVVCLCKACPGGLGWANFNRKESCWLFWRVRKLPGRSLAIYFKHFSARAK